MLLSFVGWLGVINGLVEVREASFLHSSMAPYGLAHQPSFRVM